MAELAAGVQREVCFHGSTAVGAISRPRATHGDMCRDVAREATRGVKHVWFNSIVYISQHQRRQHRHVALVVQRRASSVAGRLWSESRRLVWLRCRPRVVLSPTRSALAAESVL